uniref:Cytochrome c-type biogenesis protein CcmH n=1 Tax=Candidatus Kentrum sp. FM TaxID=2126340 RepID=A0A450WDH8_9GAMM|nr:MAG: cytochrome c-type biogenesis protein CcmH [Candidatus Kentron sp. FM]VFJ63351.1 MAG: cytochrome c-type biogenesis protein CcmH [Candidatus Kentron sp. FM]VFK15074.1 MAG: cytochrome c-type biogenesis protein CcmH [Candidatus Kentron sp. FM]
MGTFLLITTIMVGVGLAFVLRPMLRPTDRASTPSEESKAGKITDTGNKLTALLIALAIPAVSFGLYFQWGSPQILTGAGDFPNLAQHATAHSSGSSENLPSVQDMVERLAAHLEQEPDNPEGWFMLGRSYTVMGRTEEASAAFAEAYERQPDNLEILVRYAESLAEGNGGSLAGKPSELIQSALSIDPGFSSALWLAGIAAYQQNDYHEAIGHWERLQKGAELGEQEQRMLADVLSEARQAQEENTK